MGCPRCNFRRIVTELQSEVLPLVPLYPIPSYVLSDLFSSRRSLFSQDEHSHVPVMSTTLSIANHFHQLGVWIDLLLEIKPNEQPCGTSHWNNHTTPIADWLVNLFQAVQINPGYWRRWDESPSVTPVLAAIFWYFHGIFTLWKMNKASIESILAEALLVKAMKSFKSESWDRPSSRLPMCFMEASGCPKGEGPGKAKGFNPSTLGASIGVDTKGCWENGPGLIVSAGSAGSSLCQPNSSPIMGCWPPLIINQYQDTLGLLNPCRWVGIIPEERSADSIQHVVYIANQCTHRL